MAIFHTDIENLKLQRGLNGFPTYFVDFITSKVLRRYHVGISNETHDVPGVQLALPYFGIILRMHLTKLVHKFYPPLQFKIVFRREFRISSLFSYKDKFLMTCRSMAVYYIRKKCGSSQVYIGKTINSLYERFHASETGTSAPTTWTLCGLNTALNWATQNADFSFGTAKRTFC